MIEGTNIMAEKWLKMRQIIIKNMPYIPIVVDELCRWCHFSAREGLVILLKLKLTGEAQRHAEKSECHIYQGS